MIYGYLEQLQAKGRYTFSTEEAARATGLSLIALRAALRRLKQKSWLVSVYRGFWVIVPPEYRTLGCLPAEQFVPHLMQWLGLRYYTALMSAAAFHGATHFAPQMFQVMVSKPLRSIACGRVRVDFAMRKNIEKIPTETRNTPRGYLAISTVEATAFDIVGYPNHLGGLDHSVTLLSELAGKLDGAKLAELARVNPASWSQRLGYLLDKVTSDMKLTDPLAAFVRANTEELALLVPDHKSPLRVIERSKRWRLDINAVVEVEP